MSMELVAHEAHETTLTWNDEDLKALAATVAKDCNTSQFKVFVAACLRLGLDPFARQIVPIVQGGKMTPQVTIDGFRLIAHRTRQYGGQVGPFWCGPDGEWRDVWLSDTPPTAAKVGVIRRDFSETMWGVARTKAYLSNTPTWQKMPDVMIAKVAESLALRKAFPQELSGVYSPEEMDQADVVEAAPARQQPTPAAPPARQPASRCQQTQQQQQGPTWADLRKRTLQLGVRTQHDWEVQVQALTGKSDPKTFNEADKAKVVAWCEAAEATRARLNGQAVQPQQPQQSQQAQPETVDAEVMPIDQAGAAEDEAVEYEFDLAEAYTDGVRP